MNPTNTKIMKNNPKPSAVMSNLVDRSINGPYADKAKEELLKRIGTMERNNSKFFQYKTALNSILYKLKRLPSGRDLSDHSSPVTISGTAWWALNELERINFSSKEKARLNEKFDIELATDLLQQQTNDVEELKDLIQNNNNLIQNDKFDVKTVAAEAKKWVSDSIKEVAEESKKLNDLIQQQ